MFEFCVDIFFHFCWVCILKLHNNSMFNIWRNCHFFQIGCIILPSHRQFMWTYTDLSTSSPVFTIYLNIMTILVCMNQYLIVILISGFISLVTGIWSIFSCSYCLFAYLFLEKYLPTSKLGYLPFYC